MPRGSKPGERRGGRQRGTLNKKTLERNAAIEAVAADPTLSPLDYFLALMRKEELPLPTRVMMAAKALPYLHAKRGADEPDEAVSNAEQGRRAPGATVNTKPVSAQRATTTRASSPTSARPDGGPALMPLDFLLAVMRAPDTPPALRFKIACMATPYLHKKKAAEDFLTRTAGKPDQYDFAVHRETAKEIRDDTRRLGRLLRRPAKDVHRKQRKAQALAGRIRSRVQSLVPPCPSLYGPREHEKDKARYSQLGKRRSRSRLSRAEDLEEAHLLARFLTYISRPEVLARDRIKELEKRQRLARNGGAPSLSLKEKSSLRGLRTLFPKELPPPLPDHMAEDRYDLLPAEWFEPAQITGAEDPRSVSEAATSEWREVMPDITTPEKRSDSGMKRENDRT